MVDSAQLAAALYEFLRGRIVAIAKITAEPAVTINKGVRLD
jgi:hypothetical protein